MKQCYKCRESKQEVEFGNSGKTKDGLRTWCRKCSSKASLDWINRNKDRAAENRRKYAKSNKERVAYLYLITSLKSKYGLDYDDYLKMLDDQNNVCRICGELCPVHSRLSVDHYERDGEKFVRGLLCSLCNSGIGYLKHDKSIILGALKYLEETNADRGDD